MDGRLTRAGAKSIIDGALTSILSVGALVGAETTNDGRSNVRRVGANSRPLVGTPPTGLAVGAVMGAATGEALGVVGALGMDGAVTSALGAMGKLPPPLAGGKTGGDGDGAATTLNLWQQRGIGD
jgi:hypothetical protein